MKTLYDFRESKAKIELLKTMTRSELRALKKEFPNMSFLELLSAREIHTNLIKESSNMAIAKNRILSLIPKEDYYQIIRENICKDEDEVLDRIMEWIVYIDKNEPESFKDYLLKLSWWFVLLPVTRNQKVSTNA